MNGKDENLFVKIVKKSVGLPTGNSSCCGAATTQGEKECCEVEASQKASTNCGCESAASEKEEPAKA